MNEIATVTPLHSDASLRDQVHALQSADSKLTQSTIAREAGLSASAFNQWLKGVYNGDNNAVETKLRLWVEAYLSRRQNQDSMPAAPAWVATSTAVRIIGALSYAQAAADVAVIYGGAGLGKTSAIEHYRATSLNVWVATMSPATSSPVTAMEEVCSALGMTEQGGAAKLFRAIVRKVKGTRGLLIIDEAQALSTSALDQIRAIHDRAGVGLALVGNQEVYARLTGGNRAAHLDRLYSRVGKRLALKASTDDDIDSLIAAWDIGDTKCRGLLFDIARKPGALRSLTKVLRLAAMHAYAQKQRVCCEHVSKAWRELGGAE